MKLELLSKKSVTTTTTTEKSSSASQSLRVRTDIRAGRGGVPYDYAS
jgi:hypothetical protein